MLKSVLARWAIYTYIGVGVLFVLTYGLGRVFASGPGGNRIHAEQAEALLGIGALLIVLGLLMRAGFWFKGSPPGPS